MRLTFCFQALKQIKTSEFMPYVVFIAAPPVEIMRNMHENARLQGKIERIKTVSSNFTTSGKGLIVRF